MDSIVANAAHLTRDGIIRAVAKRVAARLGLKEMQLIGPWDDTMNPWPWREASKAQLAFLCIAANELRLERKDDAVLGDDPVTCPPAIVKRAKALADAGDLEFDRLVGVVCREERRPTTIKPGSWSRAT